MPHYFEINDEDLIILKDKVIVITGCSSGIGLATTKLLLDLGAKVVGGDISPPPIEHANLSFQTTNVTVWTELTSLFALAESKHGRVDHTFSNAGISGRANYMELQTDENGQLTEPTHQTLGINLLGMMNTSALGFHYMRKQQPPGGSVVVTASASSFQRFAVVDYATAKHGALGFMRGMIPAIQATGLPIRVNAIAPSWTVTGLVPKELVEKAGKATQPPEVVAKGVACLMADESRNGQLLYIVEGKYQEIDQILLAANKDIVGDDLDDNVVIERILAIGADEMAKRAGAVDAKLT